MDSAAECRARIGAERHLQRHIRNQEVRYHIFDALGRGQSFLENYEPAEFESERPAKEVLYRTRDGKVVRYEEVDRSVAGANVGRAVATDGVRLTMDDLTGHTLVADQLEMLEEEARWDHPKHGDTDADCRSSLGRPWPGGMTVHDWLDAITWPPLPKFEHAPRTDEGYIGEVEIGHVRPTAYPEDRKACQECGKPISLTKPPVFASLWLHTGRLSGPQMKNPVFCDRECWSRLASNRD